jgi:hypothetical protein
VNQQLTPDGRAIVKADFLNHLRKTNNVARAAELAGISDDTAYHWRRLDEDFARAWYLAKEAVADALEQSLTDRALDLKNPTGAVSAMFLLKGQRPHVYRDNYQVPQDLRAEAEKLIAQLDDAARERADAHLKEILAAHGIDPKLLEGPQVVEGALVEADPDAPADVLTENPDQALEHAEKALD